MAVTQETAMERGHGGYRCFDLLLSAKPDEQQQNAPDVKSVVTETPGQGFVSGSAERRKACEPLCWSFLLYSSSAADASFTPTCLSWIPPNTVALSHCSHFPLCHSLWTPSCSHMQRSTLGQRLDICVVEHRHLAALLLLSPVHQLYHISL